MKLFRAISIPLMLCGSIVGVCITTTSCTGGDGDNNCIPVEWLDIDQNGVLNGLNTTGFAGNFSNYETLKIPQNVKTIKSDAFNQNVNPCAGFNSYIQLIDIPDNSLLTTLGSSCFASCANLAGIELPISFTTFGTSCFANCPNFCMLEIDSNSVVPFASNMLDNTSYKTNQQQNQGIVMVNTAAIANQYRSASGWNAYPNDCFIGLDQ